MHLSSLQPSHLTLPAALLCPEACRGWVYSHYRLPTVVMSRLAEQFDKVSTLSALLQRLVCPTRPHVRQTPVAHSSPAPRRPCCTPRRLLAAHSCRPPRAAQAKRVLWGEVQPACDTSVMKMDYKQLCKYIRR